MLKLQRSWVKRGGVTANRWYGESDKVEARANFGGLEIRFVLPSKGGGQTSVQVVIGPEDMRVLLKELASNNPELADAFAESTYVAITSLVATDSALQT